MEIIRRGITNGAAVIYQQGGSNGPRTRTVLSDALALAQDIGASTLFVDGTLGQPTTQAVAYDWKNIALQLAFWKGDAFTLDIVDGTTFTNLEVLNSIYLNNKSASPVMTISASLEMHLINASWIQTDATGTAPFIKCLNGSNFSMFIEGYSGLDGGGHHAVIEAAAGSGATFGLDAGATITNNSLTGGGSILVIRGIDSPAAVIWATVGGTQTGATSLTLDPP